MRNIKKEIFEQLKDMNEQLQTLSGLSRQVSDSNSAITGADPEIFHVGWLSGWLPVHYYILNHGGGVAGKQ